MGSDDSSTDVCKCHHERRFHKTEGCLACTGQSLDLLARHSFIGPLPRPVLPPQNTHHLCTCGHIKGIHPKDAAHECERCDCAEYRCDHSRCGWQPREDKPAPQRSIYGCCGNAGCLCVPAECRCEAPEPPMTPEEEEQAPEDEGDIEYCVCGHEPSEHGGVTHEDPCHIFRCECPAYRTTPDFVLPPQPEQRPPYLAAYSVQGHLYEVALPGDATVRAVDGALVITHVLGPVAGIVQVHPMQKEQG